MSRPRLNPTIRHADTYGDGGPDPQDTCRYRRVRRCRGDADDPDRNAERGRSLGREGCPTACRIGFGNVRVARAWTSTSGGPHVDAVYPTAQPPAGAIPTGLEPARPPLTSTPTARSATPDEVGRMALASIAYPWQRTGYQISFLPPRTGFKGMTYCSEHRIEVYVDPGESVGLVAFITAYEMAHAVDCTYSTTTSRAEWAQIRGWSSSTPWFPPCTCSEDDYGSGDFADTFATWLTGPGWWHWRSQLAPAPTQEQISQLLPYLEPAPISS